MDLKEKLKKIKPKKPELTLPTLTLPTLKRPELKRLRPKKTEAEPPKPEEPETAPAAAKSKKSLSAHGAAAASAVVAVTAAGVLVSGAYTSPEEILSDGSEAVVQTLDTSANEAEAVDVGADEPSEAAVAEEKKRGARAGVRALMRSAPAGVRALVGVPLWGIGTAAASLASTLWTSVLSPAALALVSWLAVALLAVLIFTLAVKTAFPDLPLKKILNRRSILTILSLCMLFGLLDAVLPFFWEDYAAVSKLLRVLGSLICTGVPVAFFVRRHARKKPNKPAVEAAEEAQASLEDREAAARRLVQELADSVSRKAH